MSLDVPALRTCFGQYEQAQDVDGIPAKPTPADRCSKAGLLVVLAECRLQGREFGLDLNDREYSRRRMPRDEIDRPALAPLCIGDLRGGLPARRGELPCCGPDEPRVRLVQQSIHVGAQATDRELGTEPEGSDRSLHAGQRQAVCHPVLDERYGAPAHDRPSREVCLPPAATLAKDAHETTNTNKVHDGEC